MPLSIHRFFHMCHLSSLLIVQLTIKTRTLIHDDDNLSQIKINLRCLNKIPKLFKVKAKLLIFFSQTKIINNNNNYYHYFIQ